MENVDLGNPLYTVWSQKPPPGAQDETHSWTRASERRAGLREQSGPGSRRASVAAHTVGLVSHGGLSASPFGPLCLESSYGKCVCPGEGPRRKRLPTFHVVHVSESSQNAWPEPSQVPVPGRKLSAALGKGGNATIGAPGNGSRPTLTSWLRALCHQRDGRATFLLTQVPPESQSASVHTEWPVPDTPAMTRGVRMLESKGGRLRMWGEPGARRSRVNRPTETQGRKTEMASACSLQTEAFLSCRYNSHHIQLTLNSAQVPDLEHSHTVV